MMLSMCFVRSCLSSQRYHQTVGTQSQGGKLRAMLNVHIRGDINPIIIFRALGFVADRDVLERIVYDVSSSGDKDMMNLLQPTLEEAMYFQVLLRCSLFVLCCVGGWLTDGACARIGSTDCPGVYWWHGAQQGLLRDARIKYAKDVLRKEFLPHVGSDTGWETRKAFFFGYMIHRLLRTVLRTLCCFFILAFVVVYLLLICYRCIFLPLRVADELISRAT